MRAAAPAVFAAVCLLAGGGCSSDALDAAASAEPGYRPEIQPLGWSADGSRVRFTHTELYGGYDVIEDRDCGGSGIYETDGRSPPRPVIAGRAWCAGAERGMSVSLSADGGTVFAIQEDGVADCTPIRGLDLARRRWRRMANLCGAYLVHPALSPDGGHLAASLGCGAMHGGGKPPRVTPRGCVDRDGERFTLMRVDGSRRRVAGAPGDRYPRWSPDGRSLAVMNKDGWHIFVIDLQTGARHRVAQGESPAWSPDGRWLAFTHVPPDGDAAGAQLRVVRTDGTGMRTVFVQDPEDMRSGPQFPSPGGLPQHPLWSPDGRRIVFTKHFQSGSTLWIVNADGTGLRRLSERIEPAD
jgi:Tol biopolymer transport system component